MPSMVHNIQRTHWTNRFRLVGHPKITDFTFKIDEQSKRSSYIYSSMNLGVDCGEKYGICYADMMGGYSPEQPMPIRVHGITSDGKGTDFAKRFEVDWEDRNNEDIISTVGNNDLIKVGLQRETNGRTYVKNFLSAYDAISYIKENLTEDMTISVIGNITYNEYQDVVRMRRTITGIYLSDTKSEDFSATFVQTVLLEKDAASLKDIDKNTGLMPVDGIVLDYVKEVNGHEIRGQWPYHYNFEFQHKIEMPDVCKKMQDICFKTKKGYLKQVTFEGKFVTGGATATATWDDVPDDTKMLVEIGAYTKEEVLENLATNGPRIEHAILIRPHMSPRDGVLQIYDDSYTEKDIDISWAYQDSDDSQDDVDDDIPFDSGVSVEGGNTGEDDFSWLEYLE